jgi:multicomponent Na+:H+ antiporter subunit F
MTAWHFASMGLMAALVPCGIVCLCGKVEDRLVGLEMTGVVVTLLLSTLAQATHRVPFYDLPLTLALLIFGAGLVFARFLERWL